MQATWRVLIGDVRERLAELPDGSVQCCVTSPPYFGLRDYGAAGQIGLEASPADYVAALVGVFHQVHRVLRVDGTCWLNLGDSYATHGGENQTPHSGDIFQRRERGKNVICKSKRMPRGGGRWGGGSNGHGDVKPKDLLGIPWRVAFALQSAGWYLRADIVWHKPNPMPESVTDRPTKSHEYVFLLAKSERYYYDADAIAEPVSGAMYQQLAQGYSGDWLKEYAAAGVQNPSTVKGRIIANALKRSGNKERKPRPGAPEGTGRHQMGSVPLEGLTRNVRSVWTIQTQPYPGAHFATFPEALPERCIRAGSRVGDTVLDPFTGSGTTGQVAVQCGRSFIGIELNPVYAELARTRIGSAAPLFASEQSA